MAGKTTGPGEIKNQNLSWGNLPRRLTPKGHSRPFLTTVKIGLLEW
jgi:hypothetical protein